MNGLESAAKISMTEGVVLVSQDQQQSSLSATSEELKTMLDVIQKEILPATEKGVSNGNKVFGAAILNVDLQCEIVSTNAETNCPIFHGEVKCIVDWSQQTPSAERGPRALNGIFLATH